MAYDAKADLAQIVTSAQDLANAVDDLQVQVANLNTVNTDLQAQLTTASNALATSNTALAAANKQLTANQVQIAALKAKLATYDPWYAVDKTGMTDVTDAVQTLINQGLSIPAGTFLIDAVKGLTVTGNLVMDPDAILQVKPNGADHYCVLDVGVGASVTGGQIIGDRDTHDYLTVKSTHEWGYGIKAHTGAKIANVQISKCTGDGIGIVGDNVEVRSVSSRFNRRQAISVFTSKGFRAYDSVFSDTSGAPNGPCAGVDFEPDKGSVVDAKMYRCTFSNNRAGVLCWLRSEVVGTIDVELIDCTITANSNGVWAKDAGARVGTINVRVTQTDFAKITGNSIKADAGSTITVGDSTQANANTFNAGTVYKSGIYTKYDIAQINGGKAVVGWNAYP